MQREIGCPGLTTQGPLREVTNQVVLCNEAHSIIIDRRWWSPCKVLADYGMGY